LPLVANSTFVGNKSSENFKGIADERSEEVEDDVKSSWPL